MDLRLPIPPGDAELDAETSVATTKKPSISIALAERAAREAGFSMVSAKALKAAGILGEFVSQVGAIHLGRSRLALNLQHIDKAMGFCEERFPTAEDTEAFVGLMKVHSDLIGKSNDAAELLIKSAHQAAETAKVEAQVVLPGFSPGARVGTQVNVQVTGPATAKVESSEPIDVDSTTVS